MGNTKNICKGKKLSKEELEEKKKKYFGDNYRPEDDATEKRWTKRETTEKTLITNKFLNPKKKTLLEWHQSFGYINMNRTTDILWEENINYEDTRVGCHESLSYVHSLHEPINSTGGIGGFYVHTIRTLFAKDNRQNSAQIVNGLTELKVVGVRSSEISSAIGWIDTFKLKKRFSERDLMGLEPQHICIEDSLMFHGLLAIK
ncbi:hypothetical protein BC833DRAFT_567546 [Globomyces pollinis-pini]|nr:hypothetical protein BC833DRAFT_567546 [Globomyces pollinis-pini]